MGGGGESADEGVVKMMVVGVYVRARVYVYYLNANSIYLYIFIVDTEIFKE